MCPVRVAPVPFGATVNETGLSPACGIVVVIEIQGTSEEEIE